MQASQDRLDDGCDRHPGLVMAPADLKQNIIVGRTRTSAARGALTGCIRLY